MDRRTPSFGSLSWMIAVTVVAGIDPVLGKVCDVADYGGSTSSADNAHAIQSAVAACGAGGTVRVSGGAFRTGPIVVNGSSVVLSIENGASIVTAYGPDNWPVVNGQSLDFITYVNCDACELSGDGVIFGKGGRPPQGFDWYYLFDQGKLKINRPRLLVIQDSNNFTMSGVTLLDSPQFNVALDGVTGAEISNINITSTWYVDPKTGKLMEPHNTDGIDPGGGSNNIHIHNVFIHNGDDSVAVKPGDGSNGCTRNILVENSRFEFGHGCSIGSVGSGCVENVVFRNIEMTSQENGCRVKTYSNLPGHVTNITWESITIKNTDQCLSVNANYHPPPPNAKNWIDVSGLVFKDIMGSECKSNPEFVCPKAAPCTGIVLDNIKLTGVGSDDLKMHCENAHGSSSSVEPKSCLESKLPSAAVKKTV